MTRDEAAAAARVLLAYADGQEVECRYENQPWQLVHESWMKIDLANLEYRIKPKPREWWIIMSPTEHIGSVHDSPVVGGPPPGHKMIKVREVLE